MKKIFLLLTALVLVVSAWAQIPRVVGRPDLDQPKTKKKYRNNFIWCFEVSGNYGLLNQNLTNKDISSGYLNAVNAYAGNLTFTSGSSTAMEGQFSYFFNHKKTLGIGIGFSSSQMQGNVTLDQFAAEYQSTDFQGNTFRQKITADQPITEALKITNTNIPVVIKYKTRFSRHLGFKADFGIVYNVQLTNSYNTNASFDYEAIYQYQKNSDGTYTAVYDNSPTPTNINEWFITKNQYAGSNEAGMWKSFDSLHNQGYNVGLGVSPNKNTGNVSYTKGSIGFLVRPQFSWYMGNRLTLNIGGYIMYQSFNNQVNNNYKITDKVGEYSSVLNSVTTATFISYGGTIGLSYYFGKPQYLKRKMDKKK